MESAVDLWIFCILVGSLFDSCRSHVIADCSEFSMSLVTADLEVCVHNREEYLRRQNWCVADKFDPENFICRLNVIDGYSKIAEFLMKNGISPPFDTCRNHPTSKEYREYKCKVHKVCKSNVLIRFKSSQQHICSDKGSKWTPTFYFHEKATSSYCRIRDPKSVDKRTYYLAPDCDLRTESVVNQLVKFAGYFDCEEKGNECQNGGQCEFRQFQHQCVCLFPYGGNTCTLVKEQLQCRVETCKKGTCTKIKKVGMDIVKKNDLLTYRNDEYFCMCDPGFIGKGCQKSCIEGTYGTLCSSTCSPYCQDEKCKAEDGTCKCKKETKAYGPKCTQLSCGEDADCNGGKCKIRAGKTGVCDCSSKPGFTGQDCSQECIGNKFGAGCKEKCGHCVELPCDHRNGNCPDPSSGEAACTGAYEPPLCKSKTIGARISEITGRFRMTGGETSKKPKKPKLKDDFKEKIPGALEGSGRKGKAAITRVEIKFLENPRGGRKRRQAPESTQTAVEVSFTAEFLAEDVNDATLDQEVMSLLKKNAGKLESDLLPGMSVSKPSISVSQVRTVIAGGRSSGSDSSDSSPYIMIALCGFAVLLAGGIVVGFVRFRRQSKLPKVTYQRSRYPPGMIRSKSQQPQQQQTFNQMYARYGVGRQTGSTVA